MNMLKFLAIFVLGMALALAAIPFRSGRVVGDNEFGEPGVGEGLGS